MPNWTSNRIYIKGDQADIRAFLEAVKWEDELFDFNRIIPRPEILNHTGSGHREIDGKRIESWYIVKHAKYDPPQEPEIVRLFTPEEEAELKAIGHKDWYSWSIQNWGTKWNACEVNIEDGSEHGYAELGDLGRVPVEPPAGEGQRARLERGSAPWTGTRGHRAAAGTGDLWNLR